MATIKEATQSAMNFAVDALGDQRAVDLRLEEVGSETVDGKDCWLITLSMFDHGAASESILAQYLPAHLAKRQYKIFHVSKETGEVISLKIREFATA